MSFLYCRHLLKTVRIASWTNEMFAAATETNESLRQRLSWIQRLVYYHHRRCRYHTRICSAPITMISHRCITESSELRERECCHWWSSVTECVLRERECCHWWSRVTECVLRERERMLSLVKQSDWMCVERERENVVIGEAEWLNVCWESENVVIGDWMCAERERMLSLVTECVLRERMLSLVK